jgi:NAD kinase
VCCGVLQSCSKRRVQNVNEDTAGLTSTWKSEGDGLSVSTPTGAKAGKLSSMAKTTW